MMTTTEALGIVIFFISIITIFLIYVSNFYNYSEFENRYNKYTIYLGEDGYYRARVLAFRFLKFFPIYKDFRFFDNNDSTFFTREISVLEECLKKAYEDRTPKYGCRIRKISRK